MSYRRRTGGGQWHKYGAKPTVVDGQRFASKAEAAEWARLELQRRAGLIVALETQPAFELHAPNGEVIGKYVADFRVTNRDGEVRILDVKGMQTLPLAKWKQRHLKAEYGFVVEEIRWKG